MPKSTSEIRVGASGTIYDAPLGTTAPSDIATAWAAGWTDLGYMNEDGVSITDSASVERISVWQLFYPGRMIVTDKELTASFGMRQWNKNTWMFAHGGGTVTTTAGPPAHYLWTPPAAGTIYERMLGIEFVDGSYTYRIVVSKGIVQDDVETQLVRTAAADLPVTFTGVGADGVATWTLRTNDPAWA